ncbi:MAG: ribosome biogenesis GTPase Der [Deltaproteobacteria bacterium]|nr:ribosome biogenesis GTPase Der [Deltaproteobacteria bacterium]
MGVFKKRKRAAFRPQQRPSGALGERPVVAIVGRPNVGKSALFNRLSESRIAIVEDTPGVTRDRLYADALVFDREYVLVDTGGFDPESDDAMTKSIASQVRAALSETDLVICVYDGTVDPLPADHKATRLLRETNQPVIWVANKVDSPRAQPQALQYYSLGVSELHPISALHGHGISELEEAIYRALPAPREAGAGFDPDIPRVAIVGRPNAGKSSLVNRLLGVERQIVDRRPGTTVDSVDTLLDWSGQSYVLIDTAGMRRQRSIKRGVESLSVLSAIRAVERSDVVVLMIDAQEGAFEQDTKIASLAIDRGRALVIALNKSDLLNAKQRETAEKRSREVLSFASWAQIKKISALSGQGLNALMAAISRCGREHAKRVSTGEVNRFFAEVLGHHPPPTVGNKAIRLYYIAQTAIRPPTFAVISNHPDKVHFSYQRYVVNQLRKRFGFQGTPIRVFYRTRKRRD